MKPEFLDILIEQQKLRVPQNSEQAKILRATIKSLEIFRAKIRNVESRS